MQTYQAQLVEDSINPAVEPFPLSRAVRPYLYSLVDDVELHAREDAPSNDLLSGSSPTSMASQLRRAIAGRELALHYQPQFDLESGLACGMEALARWFPVGRGAIEPSVFITVAEQTQQIEALGNWAIEEACVSALDCCTSSAAALTLSVNVSPLQLNPALISSLQEILERTGFPATQLEVEITEGVLMRDCQCTMDCLRELKRMGLRIAIDDFGIGYSNLSYLSRFPIDTLKLDKSLTQHLQTQWKNEAVLAAVISLCKALNITVIAEGVETEGQLHNLRGLGCDQAQGFLLGHPVELDQARLIMEKRWGSRSLVCSAANDPVVLPPRMLAATLP